MHEWRHSCLRRRFAITIRAQNKGKAEFNGGFDGVLNVSWTDFSHCVTESKSLLLATVAKAPFLASSMGCFVCQVSCLLCRKRHSTAAEASPLATPPII